jgi:peroxiredoxin
MSNEVMMGRLVLAIVVSAGHRMQAQAPKVGLPAPAFALATIDGDSVRLSQFRGKPVVLKFWATWCPTCRTEMPELVAARGAQASSGLQVLAINAEDPPARMRRYLTGLSVSHELVTLIDPHSHVGKLYHVPVLPTTMFVDSAGVVRAIHQGAITPVEFADGIRAIIPTQHQE